MKLYRPVAEAIVYALEMILKENRYPDKVLEKIFKRNNHWKGHDRQLAAETIYDIVRWYRLLRHLGSAGKNDFWKILGTWLTVQDYEIPRWQEFFTINKTEIRSREKEMQAVRKIRESVPDWLDELGENELGERWDTELKALNSKPGIVIRVNTLKISKEDLERLLADEGVKTNSIEGFPDALSLPQWKNVFTQPAFKEGLFEVQDAASQLIAPFLRVTPGLRVIDACAGSGGKTLHIATLMQNKGRIIAMDTEEWKLDELRKRARRCGVGNTETKIIDSTKVIKRFKDTADRLLLDVPCSGLGVLKRNPDAKWKLTPEYIKKLTDLQQKILTDYSVMVKSGGLLEYSTCSILPSENEKQIHQFLSDKNTFELVDEKHCWPSEGFDGFYMALLRKK